MYTSWMYTSFLCTFEGVKQVYREPIPLQCSLTVLHRCYTTVTHCDATVVVRCDRAHN